MTDTREEDKKKFILWEQKVFGYGYGTGEGWVLKSLKAFLKLCPSLSGCYDYKVLENELTPIVTWLLINILCKANFLEYGTSPRFGWLTEEGKEIKSFIEKYTVEELEEILDLTEEENAELYGEEQHES